MLCSFITDRADGDEETKADMGKEQVLEETQSREQRTGDPREGITKR